MSAPPDASDPAGPPGPADPPDPPPPPRRVYLGPTSFLPSRGFVVVPLLPPFRLPDGTRARSALVGRAGGELRAYANVCRHLAITLDLGDGEVMDDERVELVCHHHGARFEPGSGECVFGPCFGKSLFRFGIEVESGEASLVLELKG